MIRLRSLLQSQSRTLLAGGVLALACLALAWAHSAPAAEHMAVDGDSVAAISTCLAVASTGLGLLAAVGGVLALRRRRPWLRLAPTAPVSFSRTRLPGPAAARAGPAVLQVFLR